MRAEIEDEEWLMVLAARAPPLLGNPQPLVQGLATTGFRLLAVTVTDESNLSWGDRLYIGPGVWDRVVGIEQQLTYQWLTPAVQSVLQPTVAAIIRRNETRFIEAFNTTVLDDLDGHPLALLSNLVPDCRKAVIEERSKRRFNDFGDLTARVDCLDQPQELLVERVLDELRAGEDAYHWLTV
jgi:putative nucleotide binding protein